MKKIGNLLVLTLAVNFILAAAGVAWLYQSGHLDRERARAVKEIVFPATQPTAPTSQPAEPEAPTADKQLEELLAKALGKGTAAEQVEFLRSRYDQSMLEMERRRRELEDLEHQVTQANRKLLEDRKALDAQQKALAEREQQSDKLANDKGFQDTLAIFIKLPPKEAKARLAALDDSTAANYLDAMEPGTAGKIIKEFGKTADDKTQIKRILDKIRMPRQTASAGPAGDGKE